ncbi:MAG: hypothetical protein QOG34_1646, partial [Frankiaceae bacterium]|nr:hypothetical protein [Frankiaceae bacterium]
GVTPPPGSFTGEAGYGEAAAPTAPPATTERQSREREGGAVTLLSRPRRAATDDAADTASAPAKRAPAKKTAAGKAAAKKTSATKASPRKSSSSEGDS